MARAVYPRPPTKLNTGAHPARWLYCRCSLPCTPLHWQLSCCAAPGSTGPAPGPAMGCVVCPIRASCFTCMLCCAACGSSIEGDLCPVSSCLHPALRPWAPAPVCYSRSHAHHMLVVDETGCCIIPRSVFALCHGSTCTPWDRTRPPPPRPCQEPEDPSCCHIEPATR